MPRLTPAPASARVSTVRPPSPVGTSTKVHTRTSMHDFYAGNRHKQLEYSCFQPSRLNCSSAIDQPRVLESLSLASPQRQRRCVAQPGVTSYPGTTPPLFPTLKALCKTSHSPPRHTQTSPSPAHPPQIRLVVDSVALVRSLFTEHPIIYMIFGIVNARNHGNLSHELLEKTP